MNHQQIGAFLRGVVDKQILVVGDLMLDRYIRGDAERISPEAPIPVVRIGAQESRPGGAGNVACNLAALGCKVNLIGAVGADEEGRELQESLAAVGINPAYIQQWAERDTTCKTRILANNQQVLRLDREQLHPIGSEQERAVLDCFRRVLPQMDVVLLSDYGKGLLTEDLLAEVVALCREQSCPVIIDPKSTDFSRYRGATLVTPNLDEAERAAGLTINDDSSLRQVALLLQKQLEGSQLLLTRGAKGMTLFDQKGDSHHIPTAARGVFDVSGAGDTVVAFLGAGLAAGLSLRDAAGLANLAAGIVVGKVGTAAVSPAELLLQAQGRGDGSSAKLVPLPELSVLIRGLQEQGRTVVFTNGCFDLLHAGHVKYLQKAKQLGDILVLGLNSDTSVRRLKGEKRPLLKQDERAQLLAALDCVDFISIFAEDTPYDLICQLRPDILTKGGDYRDKDIVGKDLVESYGGRLVLLDFIAGRSTSHIIDDVLTRYRD